MSIKVKALEGYFGGKGGSGTYQQIINLIPPHTTLVVPFLGHCGITRNLKPCQNWYLNDIDKKVISEWLFHFQKSRRKKQFAPSTTFLNQDWKEMFSPQMDRKEVVFYLDPTYPEDTRKSDHKYDFELTDEDHEDILDKALEFNFANFIISTYDNELYKSKLKDWNKISFQSKTRRGVATETAYYNFETPTELHDYRYMGNDYRERCDYKRKLKHMVAKFDRMTPLEFNYFMGAILADHNVKKTDTFRKITTKMML